MHCLKQAKTGLGNAVELPGSTDPSHLGTRVFTECFTAQYTYTTTHQRPSSQAFAPFSPLFRLQSDIPCMAAAGLDLLPNGGGALLSLMPKIPTWLKCQISH